MAFIGGGLGVVGVGIGTWASLRAVGKNDDSNTPGGCRGDACSPRGKDDRDAARRAGTLATVSLLAGGTLVAGALVLYLVKGRHHEPEAAHWQVAPAVGPRYGGLALGGSF